MKYQNKIKNKKGSLTVQFLLGFALILSFVLLFSAMVLTLTVSSITQYITFSASRELFLDQGSVSAQQRAAEAKYSSLKDSLHFKNLFKNNLFQIGDISTGDEKSGMGFRRSGFGAPPNLFYGVWTKFNPKILDMKTMWGSTEPESDDFFETTIGSYLGTEPTKEACINFTRIYRNWIAERIQNTPGLPIRLSQTRAQQINIGPDNGC